MLLGFYPQIGGKPTRFKEKIHAGLKRHSMRKNKSNRWKVGMAISMVYGLRTKHMERFHEATVKGFQTVKFVYEPGKAPAIFIDGRLIGIMEAITLATNDGFETFSDFLKFFNENETYTLIHWTDLKYNGDPAQWEDANNRGVVFYGWGKQSVQRALLDQGTHAGDALAYLVHSLQPSPKFPPGGVHVNRGSEAFYIAERGHEWLAERTTLEPVPYPKANEWAIDTEGGNDAWKVFAQSEDKEMQKRFQNLRIEPMPGVGATPENMVYSLPVSWVPLGIEEGAMCQRDGCTGKIAFAYEGEGCTCFNNPPCNYCLSSYLHCPTCGWDELGESDECHGLNEDLQANSKVHTININDEQAERQAKEFWDILKNEAVRSQRWLENEKGEKYFY